MATSSISKFTFQDLYFLDFQWDIYQYYNNDPLLADDDGLYYRSSSSQPINQWGIPRGRTWNSTNAIVNLSKDTQYLHPFRFAGAPLSSGLRDVSGFNNNLISPWNGSSLTLFERLFPAEYINTTGGFSLELSGFGAHGPIYDPIYDASLTIDYQTRGTIVIDAQPRIISNLVCDFGDSPLTSELDNPRALEWTPFGTQTGNRISPLTGGVNPLAASNWMSYFGQFFDHGLDLIAKGKDGKVYMPLLPGDPLYDASGNSGALSQGRSNTIRVEIGEGSTDDLLTELGLQEFVDPGKARLDSSKPELDKIIASYGAVLSVAHSGATGNTVATTSGGTFVLNGIALVVKAGATWNDIVTLLNSIAPSTGVTAQFAGSQLLLLPASGESINRISPFIDLSQSYGSVNSLTVLLKEYTDAGIATGKLLNQTPRYQLDGFGQPVLVGGKPVILNEGTLSDWASVKANALKLGLTLHDKDIDSVPLIELSNDGHYYFVALNAVTGEKVPITDTADYRLKIPTGELGRLVLLDAGVAFLDDIGFEVPLKTLSLANPDLAGDELDKYYIAGDGRANENIALTSIHQIFHTIHNQIADKIVANWNSLTTAEKTALGGVPPSGEALFQQAKLVTEMIYQHRVFDEFARKLSPNIGAFSAFSPLLESGVMLEFAQAVYRFGHSQIAEKIDLQGFNALSGLAEGAPLALPLFELFLKPGAFQGEHTAGELALGLSNQVQYQIDQYVGETLRNNLLGVGLDLGAFNLMRGRDEGMPSLNHMRAEIYKFLQANIVPGLLASPAAPAAASLLATVNSLRPYVSWQDFADHLLVPGTVVDFIMAYARDAVLGQYATLPDGFSDWNAYQLGDPGGYLRTLETAAAKASNDESFMGESYQFNTQLSGSNQDFNAIDLWVGGLAEAKTPGGMLGPTFDFIFALQMAKLQDGDRHYYLDRVVGTDFFIEEIDSRTFADLVMEATGTRHMYLDIMSVNDSDVEISNFTKLAATAPNYTLAQLQATNSAGWVHQQQTTTTTGTGRKAVTTTTPAVDTFYGNPGNYTSADGLINPNGYGNASEMIGGTSADERIFGLGGNDTIWGDGGVDTIDGGLGNDFLDGGAGDDTIIDEGGDDFMRGGDGNDTMRGEVGIDAMFGQNGNDTMYGGAGADAINGGDGDDLMYGGDNILSTVTVNGVNRTVRDVADLANAITGGRGNDRLYGGGAADALNGGVGADQFWGAGGADTIACGLDDDQDRIYFDEAIAPGVFDTITQFSVAGHAAGYLANDMLIFSQSALPATLTTTGTGRRQTTTTTAPAIGVLQSTQFEYTTSAAPQGSTAAIRFLYDKTLGQLWYDPDGNGALVAEHVATLAPYDPLNPNDPLAVPPVITNTNIQII